MDTNQPPSYSAPVAQMGIFGTRIPSTVTFAVGVLLFLLPFAEIKCNDTPFMQNSGLGIATGKEWEVSEKGMFGWANGSNNSRYADTKRKPNSYALVALALGVGAVILTIPKARAASGVAMASGVFAAITLIGLWIDLKRQTRSWVKDSENTPASGADEINISLQMTPWFYVSVIAFLVAAFFCYKRMQATKQ